MTAVDRTNCAAPRHGNEAAYSGAACRCPDARAAWTLYSYQLRHHLNQPRHVDAKPTAQRLQILAAIGYDWRTLTRHLQYRSPKAVTELAYHTRPKVHRRTAGRIRDLYNQLIALPPPCGYPAGRAINNAVRAGWGVVDLETVWRALAGHKPDLTPLERRAVIFTGDARGINHTAIAKAAGASGETVNTALAA